MMNIRKPNLKIMQGLVKRQNKPRAGSRTSGVRHTVQMPMHVVHQQLAYLTNNSQIPVKFTMIKEHANAWHCYIAFFSSQLDFRGGSRFDDRVLS